MMQSTHAVFLRLHVVAIFSVAPTLLATLHADETAPGIRRPNVVLVVVDDLGWTDLGCYGSRYYQTPHIDALAATGVRFTDAYAACAVCSPTRAAVLTGRYPARIGITDWIRARFQGGNIPKNAKPPSGYTAVDSEKLQTPRNALWMALDEVTIAEVLKAEGYATCHIGKWHLGTEAWHPDKQGFDRNVGGCDYGQPPSYFSPYETKRRKPIPTLPAGEPGEYLTDREASEAVRFIREHKDQSFFLSLCHYAVHTPIQAKDTLILKYERLPKSGQKSAVYAAMIESVDDAFARIEKTLEELDLTDNTIIIFTSDNGGLSNYTSNAPLRAGKGKPYEGGIRVPLIIRWPAGKRHGTTCKVPASSIDIFPTLLDLCDIPTAALPPIDGVSLVGLLDGEETLDREALFWHFPHYRIGNVAPYGIVRIGPYKLIRHYENNRLELYNLETDLSESKDLSAELPEKAQQLDTALSKWLIGVGAKMPVPNPNYEPPNETATP